MPDNREVLDLLHELIHTCKDGETGYAHAAGIVGDQRLKDYFREQSLERARFVMELKGQAERLGDDLEPSTSVAGTLHRVWFEAKADVGLGDQSILNSVEQGEDSAKKSYQKALDSELTEALRGIIRGQAQSVFAAHDFVRDLRDRGFSQESKVA